MRGVRRWPLATVALLSGLWTLGVSLTGGVDVVVAGVRIVSRSPVRPAALCLLTGAAYLALNGRERARQDVAATWHALTAARVAMALALATLAVAITWNSWSAGGADSYAYVTQADLWLDGNLKVSVPLAAHAPWPNALGTFTPFGYRATPDGSAIVPVTAPGLPLLMALMKAMAGHAAMFWVVPLCGALLVWSTFLVGRRLGSDAAGLGASLLVATSPTFLSMAKSVMSDVPAAAFWTLSMALLLSETVAGAAFAGASAAAALVIRPNLAPVGVALVAFAAWREWRAPDRRWWRVFALGGAMVPGALIVAAVNAWLYGGPLSSGYGNVQGLFSLANVPVNLRQYLAWLIDTQTWAVTLGLVAVLLPIRHVWGTTTSLGAPILLAGVFGATWISYLAYSAFDAWWFLRFLLPSWSSLFVALAWILRRGSSIDRVWGNAMFGACIVVLSLFGLSTALRLGVFPTGEGERRYATIAELVARETDPAAVIIAGQHVGAVRYYAGRQTIQFAALEPEWLDRTLTWLETQHRRPYLLLEDWEVPLFRQRFGQSRRTDLDHMDPVLAYTAYRIDGTVYLFDPIRPRGPTRRPLPIRNPRPRAPLPATTAIE